MVDHECVFVQSSPPPGVPHAPQYQGCVCILCVLPPSAVLWKAPCPIRTTTGITANDQFLRFTQIGAERSFSPPPPNCKWLYWTSAPDLSIIIPLYTNLEAPWSEKCLTPSLSAPLPFIPLKPTSSMPPAPRSYLLKQPPFSVTETKAPSFVCFAERNVLFRGCVSVQLYLQSYMFSFILLCAAQLSLTFPLCSFVGFHFTPRGSLRLVTPTSHNNPPPPPPNLLWLILAWLSREWWILRPPSCVQGQNHSVI